MEFENGNFYWLILGKVTKNTAAQNKLDKYIENAGTEYAKEEYLTIFHKLSESSQISFDNSFLPNNKSKNETQDK
jgi:hypothetical protein